MGDVQVELPDGARRALRGWIEEALGNEVLFFARVEWEERGGRSVAVVSELEVAARGNAASVLALVGRAEGWDLAIHNHPGGSLEPSDADHAVAHALAERGVGAAIISNDAERLYLVVPPVRAGAGPVPIDLDEVRHLLGPDGPLAAAAGDFEWRQGQVDMAVGVARALNEDLVLAAEAGTGVGKSFAYLIPSILWAARNRQRVVISTGTKNLQQQLVSKDLPLLEKVLPVQFRHALIVGRGNYVCRRKLGEAAAELEREEVVEDPTRLERAAEMRELVAWARSSASGSRADLAWVPSGDAWEEIMSETDKSLKVQCPHYSECFYYVAKKQAASADLVVVNHHLFFADLAVRRGTGDYDGSLILPAHKRVVFDEAHHLEDVASQYLGVEFAPRRIATRLARLLSPRDSRRGLIPSMARRLQRSGDGQAAAEIERIYKQGLPPAREAIEDAFDSVAAAIDEARGGLGGGAPGGDEPAPAALAEGGGEGSEGAGGRAAPGASPEAGTGSLALRYRGEGELDLLWGAVAEGLARVRAELSGILAVNDRGLEALNLARVNSQEKRSMKLELDSFRGRTESIVADIGAFLQLGDPENVRWIEARRGRDGAVAWDLVFAGAPVRVGDSLRAAIFERLSTVVLTSATLSVGGKIDFLAGRLGLDGLAPERFAFQEHASPFRFREQASLLIPTDMPPPQAPQFARSVADAVLRIVEASGGRAFVLFTSYSLLRRTHDALRRQLLALGLNPLAQGLAERSALLERFRSTPGSVLFGTDSFWEGVDVKGRALECVVIVRLPFRVPTEPVQEARAEDVERRGGSAFSELTIPQAVLKLKQGFGRLIRSTSDRGVVVVLDQRILTKPYGRVFLRSLPETDLVRGPLDVVVRRIRSFIGGAGPPVLDAGALSPGPPP